MFNAQYRLCILNFFKVLFIMLPYSSLLGDDLNKQTLPSYKYELSVCTIFKDEAPWLKEWIEYHKLLGVQHFLLFNNESTDNYLEVLDPYIKNGDVHVVNWPGGHGNWPFFVQAPAILHGVAHLRGVSKWLAIIDVDEFILPLTAPDLVTFLKDYEQFSAVVINWLHFGTSGIQDVPADKLMIEVLTLRSHENDPLNQQVKSIVKPECMDGRYVWTPHLWSYLPGCLAVAPNKKEFVWGVIDVSQIRINHYITRTENYLFHHKIMKKKRMENENAPDFIKIYHHSCNVIEDKSIFRFLPALRERIFGPQSRTSTDTLKEPLDSTTIYEANDS